MAATALKILFDLKDGSENVLLQQYRMHFDTTREIHIFKWTIRKLVKKEKQLSSEADENTPIDLIKTEVDPLYSLSFGSSHSCLH